jgi:hypothetical protein
LVAQFDGGAISSDGGAPLLGLVEARTRIIERAAQCFVDYRDPKLLEHTVRDLVGQRVYALVLGYEDLNDHDRLRHDPLLAAVVGKRDPSGQDRVCESDRGKALAGKSTLNRLELTVPGTGGASRYKRIEAQPQALDALLVDLFIEAHDEAPAQIVLDVDATDDPIHGEQEGRFFHGYYRCYCYLPLYVFCGEHLLCARLRRSNIDGAAGVVEELERIVGQIREHWPQVEIVVRGDSGFCREALMSWCETNAVHYVLGLAKNERLVAAIASDLEWAELTYDITGLATRYFADFQYQTRESWSRARRVVGKAEWLPKGPNPRFIVTSLAAERYEASHLYEAVYCARGDMENRIKEQQLDLFADRTSAGTMWANQLRLYFSSLAYCLLQALRRLGLAGTSMAKAQCSTLRLRLLKIGARVKVTVRNIWVSLSQSYPDAELFAAAHHRLLAPPAR